MSALQGFLMMNQQIAYIKILDKRYADLMMEKGQIHFSRPITWSQMGENGDAVRGDPLEGCFASLDNPSEVLSWNREAVDSFSYNGLTRYRSLTVCNLAAYCLYGLAYSDFSQDEIDNIGDVGKYTFVEERYFSNFGSVHDEAEYDAVPIEQKPTVVLIHNPSAFVERLARALSKEIGFGQVLFKDVDYIDASVPYCLSCPCPNELFVKSNQYSYQHEIRFVINAQSDQLASWFERSGGNVEIGPIDDIATKVKGYYFKDVCMMVKGGKLLYSIPEPVVQELGNIHSMPLSELVKNYWALVDFCSRYDDEVNHSSMLILEEEIRRRTGAKIIRYDSTAHRLYVLGCDDPHLIPSALKNGC